MIMGGTTSGAAKRKRCTCGQFEHPGRECGRPGPRPYKTAEEKAATNRAYTRKWRHEHPEENRAHKKKYRDSVKLRVLRAYSGEVPSCACCQETGLVFLTLDHVDGDGAAQRRVNQHRGGFQQYLQVIREGFPPGYAVLCWNCNSAKHLLGTCPHQLSAEASTPSRS